MKNYFQAVLILIISLLGNQCISQIVLDTTDLPVIGNIQFSVKVDSLQGSSLSPGVAGDNRTWNFSSLLPCCGNKMASLETLKWINPATTPNGNYFNSSKLSDAMNCVNVHSHSTHTDKLVCDYFYYVKNTDGLKLYGMDKQNNIILNQYYNIFPLLNYGSTTSNIAVINEKINDTLFVNYMIDTSTADAWGTITTPAGTINSIRVFTKESVYDSIYVNGVGYQTGFTNGNYYYRWYAKGLKYPVLEIYKGIRHQKRTNVQKVLYADSLISISTGINTLNDINKFKIYPNPATNELHIETTGTEKLFAQLFDLTGKNVTENISLTNITTINLQERSQGIYYLRITNENSGLLKSAKIAVIK